MHRTNLILQMALEYVAAGLSVIPTVHKTKAPALKEWKTFQNRYPTASEIRGWFQKPGKSVGIVTGKVSGHLEVLDFDHRAELYETWADLVQQESPDLLKRLVLEKTQNSGMHAVYRCPEVKIPGNQKLAMRAIDVTDQVLAILRDAKVDPDDQGAVRQVLTAISIDMAGKKHTPRLVNDNFVVLTTMIETRGEGGQFLAAPSPGYELLQGDFTAIPVVTVQERRLLISAALALNEWVEREKVEGLGQQKSAGTRLPGDDFNERGDIAQILHKHGWVSVRNNGVYEHWRRPAKDRGVSGSLIKGRFFKVFSTNALPFEAEKVYSPFAIFTLLEHGGDYSAAARDLIKQGYGDFNKTASVNGGQAAWPDPEPLRRSTEPPQPFPVESLGKVLRPASLAIHDIVKAPLAICCQSVLAAANLVVQGHANVSIDGRLFPLSEYFLSIALSGERKSTADRAALAPVEAHQKVLLTTYKKEMAGYEIEAQLWKRERDEALKKKCPSARREALEALRPPAAAPLYPQLLSEEPTYEGLVKLLALGWPSVGLFSDEGGRFLGGHAMSPDHRLKTLAGLSDLWDGRPITRTRASDGAVTLYGRRSCVNLLMQPLVAENLLADNLAHEQGFLSRCLICAPDSCLGKQFYTPQDLTQHKDYKHYCARLTEILTTELPLKIDEDSGRPTNELVPRALSVSPKAKEIWIRFHDHIQANLGPEGELRSISGIAAKAAEHTLRLAGTLALMDDLNAVSISSEHVEAGIILARFYLSEALRLFNAAKTNPDLVLAEKVLTWLCNRNNGDNYLISLPDVYQFGPKSIRDKATALRIMGILSDHHWVRPKEGKAVIDGKIRRQIWELRSDV